MTANHPPVGIYPDVPAEQYHAWTLPGNSALTHLARSPLHYQHALANPEPPTPDMMLGTAVHAAILEPDLFADRYIRACRCSAVLKTGKRAGGQCESDGVVLSGGDWFCRTHSGDQVHDPAGKVVLTEDDMADVERMVAAVRAHPWASASLRLKGRTELSIVFQDAFTKVLCKMRVDRLIDDRRRRCIVDVKTSRNASRSDFAKTIHDRRYHRQAAMYLRGCQAVGIDVDAFTIIAVDKDPPYAVAAYKLDDEDIAAGADELDRLLALYADCTASDCWPGYGDELQPIRLPPWARPKPEMIPSEV